MACSNRVPGSGITPITFIMSAPSAAATDLSVGSAASEDASAVFRNSLREEQLEFFSMSMTFVGWDGKSVRSMIRHRDRPIDSSAPHCLSNRFIMLKTIATIGESYFYAYRMRGSRRIRYQVALKVPFMPSMFADGGCRYY